MHPHWSIIGRAVGILNYQENENLVISTKTDCLFRAAPHNSVSSMFFLRLTTFIAAKKMVLPTPQWATNGFPCKVNKDLVHLLDGAFVVFDVSYMDQPFPVTNHGPTLPCNKPSQHSFWCKPDLAVPTSQAIHLMSVKTPAYKGGSYYICKSKGVSQT